MTGRYRISLADPRAFVRPDRVTRKRWSVFVRTCESLAADGLTYFVSFVLSGADPHILITASGTVTHKRRHVSPRHGTVPPVKSQECAVRALEAEWFLPENATKRNSKTTHWQRRGAQYAELNAMAEEQLRGEVEFWRELELLSGQREQFKPGLTNETAWVDEEVAA